MAIKDVSKYYSCRRKRDYITILAVGLFLVMLLAQFYLVLILPVQLRKQETLEYHVSHQQMLRRFDTLRGNLGYLRASGTIAKGELDLIRETFEQLQMYVRENRDTMTLAQVVQVGKLNKMLDSAYVRCSRGKYHIRQEKFNPAEYVLALEDLIREEESASMRD